jgi:hypothetical protein
MNEPQIPAPLLSPRTRFQKSGVHVSDHRHMTGSTIFETATDAAMNQYALELASQSGDQWGSMSAGLRLKGAQEYLMCLKALAEKPHVPQPQIRDNLDPKN